VTLYGVDVASYQGRPNWAKVFGAGVRFGFSKVTQSTNYVNPTWAHNRQGMASLGGKFLPGAYHFLHGGNGAAQARYFLQHAGDVSGMAVALDVEAEGADAATSRDWVAEFKRLTGGHPVLGYFPRWYWQDHGKPDLSFFDGLWQSSYVSGHGTAAELYAKVPSSWWAAFGNEAVQLLQFSSSGDVPGVSGRCDVSAYRGSFDQLRALALGKDHDMELDDSVPVGDAYAGDFAHKSYPVSFTMIGSFAEAKRARLGIAQVLAKLDAQQATIDKLVDAVAAGPGVDLDALKQEIKDAIESVVVHLDVQDPTDPE
jgi:GH25 family lysozyme M1 (1,4-beta-N-acetylmuramidase)